MSKKVTLHDEKILDRWSLLIEGAQGRGDEVIKKTVEFIKEASAPGVEAEMARVFPPGVPKFLSGVIKGVFEKGRDYLMVTNEGLGKVRLYVGAQDYGNNLYVSWYLATEPGLLDHFSAFLTGAIAGTFTEKGKWVPVVRDLFMQEELTAYVTCVHHCILKAVESLMMSLGQDFSKVDRKSKGFLGVS